MNRLLTSQLTSCALLIALCTGQTLLAEELLPAYLPGVKSIFRKYCVTCHNSSRAEAQLDLSTYASSLAGSSSGELLAAGDPLDSYLYLCVTKQEQPYMPPKKDLSTGELEMLKDWILLGMPESQDEARKVLQENPQALSESALTQTPKMTGDQPERPEASSGSSGVASGESNLRVYRGSSSGPPTAMAVNAQDSLLAVAGQQQILVFDLKTQALKQVLPFPEGEAFVLRFSPDGSVLLAGGGVHGLSGQVVLWDTDTLQRIGVIGDEFDTVLAADMSPDGRHVVLAGPGRVARVFDTVSGEAVHEISKHTDWVLDANFSPDSLLFATADRAGNLFVWETESGQELHTLRGQVGAVTGLGWTSDGNVLVAAASDGIIRMWDMHSGEQVMAWPAHPQGILRLAVHPSGLLITLGRDELVKIWALDGRLLHEIHSSQTPVLAKVVSEEELVIADWSGAVTPWKLTPEPASGKQFAVPPSMLSDDLAALVPALDEIPLVEPEWLVSLKREAAAAQPLGGDRGELALPSVQQAGPSAATLSELAIPATAIPATSVERLATLAVLESHLSAAVQAAQDSGDVEVQVLAKVTLEKVRARLETARQQAAGAQ